jgi:hypothetical protein
MAGGRAARAAAPDHKQSTVTRDAMWRVFVPRRGLGWRQRRQDLVLVALDALRARHDGDELRKAFEPGQPNCRKAR